MSLVKMLRGAVSFGVFGFSPFPVFFLLLGVDFVLGLSVTGELDEAMALPLRVRREVSSFSVADFGVGGEPGYILGLFYYTVNIARSAIGE
jgi:hypothetical protein